MVRSITRVRLAAALLVGPMLTLGACATTVPRERVYVRAAPPPERVEVVAVAPGPRYVWVRGHWRRDRADWDWVPGRWVAIAPGYNRWVAGHWARNRYGWYWVDGRWR